MLEFRDLRVGILVITILGINLCCQNKGAGTYSFGWENRLMASTINMDCSFDNLAIYNEYSAYRCSKEEYEIISTEQNLSEIGEKDFTFRLKLKIDPKIVEEISLPRISICLDDRMLIGRGNPMISSNLPGVCHFFFTYNSDNKVDLNKNDELICFSIKFLTADEYVKEILGVTKQ